MKKVHDFTIAFIAHNDFEIASRTIPQNIKALTQQTNYSYHVILVLDGFEAFDCQPYINKMSDWGVDEIRLRSRGRVCAGGDPSNNAHLYLLSLQSKYMIEIESDVALFETNQIEDPLKELDSYFNRNKDQCMATKVEDFDCWQWKLEKVSEDIDDGVWSTNRLSSHFLVYQTERFLNYLDENDIALTCDTFHDDGENWFNYEDFLSYHFAKPNGPGIGFFRQLSLDVYHCDEKEFEGSAFYKKDIDLKCSIFDKLKDKYL